MESAQLSLEIQKNGIDLARRRLENAEYLMRQGKRDNRDLVDAQQSLLSAQDQYESARANLQVQILRFLRDTGTLRVDPQAGSIGHALDRAAFSLNDGQLRR
jgi:outer membrane protein TolC